MLKQHAHFFLCPEMPVAVGKYCTARCYFDRPSAPEQLSAEEATEVAKVLEDALSLRQLAVDYLCPEKPVITSDATAFGRNYFSRVSAPVDDVDYDERASILEDCYQLKKLAMDYMHPEVPVAISGGACFGRNFFYRFEAPVVEDFETRESFLMDAMMLKASAVDYRCPERSVVADLSLCCRNYFSRPSATPQQTREAEAYRSEILEDAAQLKNLAVDYLCPEKPVAIDPCLFGRNFFSRPSAPVQHSKNEMEERARIIEDAKSLKQLAIDYLHPELPVVTSDRFCTGRNFFSRFSAVPKEEEEESAERTHILEDAAALKACAIHFLHPEIPIKTTDPTACGRNYFCRASAIEFDEEETEEERSLILDDAKHLKRLATDYLCPEREIAADATLFGRNFFSRASAYCSEGPRAERERLRIIKDCEDLKGHAIQYLKPELPISVDGFSSGRNFFCRPSAPRWESFEEMMKKAQVLEDVGRLKAVAVNYFHPELPMTTSAEMFGRNFFLRASAPEQLHQEDIKERTLILKDTERLKQLAVDFMHPEIGVKTSDPTSFGRNVFSRPSASGHFHMIHTFPPHEHDDDHTDHHEEHFGMDEELGLVSIMQANSHLTPSPDPTVNTIPKEEGNLSRSPSSVMLFSGEV